MSLSNSGSIYLAIELFNLEKKVDGDMKYFVSILGASLIFVCSFILIGLFLILLIPASRHRIDNLPFPNIASLIAFILASLAATHSFRATLKKYKKDE